MRMLGKVGVSWSLWFVVAITAASGAEPTNGTTALDEYIAKRDPTYAWKLVNTIPGDGVTTYVVELTSQTWRAKPEVDRPVDWSPRNPPRTRLRVPAGRELMSPS